MADAAVKRLMDGDRILEKILLSVPDADLRDCLATVFETHEGLSDKLTDLWVATQQVGVQTGRDEGRPFKRARLDAEEDEDEGGEVEAVFDSQTMIEPELRTVRNHYPDPETASVKSLVDDQEPVGLELLNDQDDGFGDSEDEDEGGINEAQDGDDNDETSNKSQNQDPSSHESDSAIVVSPRLQLKRTADMIDEVDVSKILPPSESQGRILKLYHQSLLVRCVNCGIQYDKEDDKDQVCRYHSGRSEFDEDGWEDHPQPVQVVDTDTMRLIMPSVFLWNCCSNGDDGTSERSSVVSDPDWDYGCDEEWKGCRVGRHMNVGSTTHFAELQMLREIKEKARFVLKEPDTSDLDRY